MPRRTRASQCADDSKKTLPPVRTAVCLSAESYQRLRAASVWEHQTQSAVIEGLIRAHLSGYYVGRRTGRPEGNGDGAGEGGP